MSLESDLVYSDIFKLCRICRKFTNGMCFKSEVKSLIHLYEFCCGIKVLQEHIPRNICDKCVKKIKDFAVFKEQALESEKLWKAHINNDDGESKETWNMKIKDEKVNKNINFNLENVDSKDENIESFDCDGYTYDQDMKTQMFNVTNKNMELSSKSKTGSFSCNKTMKKIGHRNPKMIRKAKVHKELGDSPTFACGLCDITSADANKDKQHLTEHSSNNDLNCRLCGFVGRDFADMVTHRYDHHPKEYRIHLNCHLCPKKYIAKLALQFHYRSVHLKKKGGLCSQCGKQFGTYAIWRDHEKLHTTENYKCDLCGRKFLFRHALKKHIIIHSEVNGYVCDVCGKGFKRNSNLKLHLQTAHDSNKVNCEHCNGTFKNQKSLKAHLQRVNKEKKIQCEVCSKYFDTPNRLRRHMVWHGDERPFVCIECGLSYKSTSQLNIHMRKHTGVMPFKCNECAKSYPTSNQLREHMSNHSGERRYKCLYCPKSFHHKKLMVKHCAKEHKVDDKFQLQKKELTIDV